jgi:hypothetical protein
MKQNFILLLLLIVSYSCLKLKSKTTGGLYENVPYAIFNTATKKALQVEGVSTNNGATISQWGYVASGQHFRWIFTNCDSQGYCTLKNFKTGKCLAVDGDSRANGGKIIQWGCSDAGNFRWAVLCTNSNCSQHVIKGKNSGKCIHISNSKSDNGIIPIQWDCINARPEFNWTLVHLDNNGNTYVPPQESILSRLTLNSDIMNRGY